MFVFNMTSRIDNFYETLQSEMREDVVFGCLVLYNKWYRGRSIEHYICLKKIMTQDGRVVLYKYDSMNGQKQKINNIDHCLTSSSVSS